MSMTKVGIDTFYSYEEAKEASENYFDGSGEIEASAFLNKYALKTLDGKYVERTPDDMHHRIAGELARIEQNYPNPVSEEEIYQYLKGFEKIIPQGSPMAGIGNPYQVMSLSNCFVIGNKADSYGGITQLDQELVQLMKRRAGVGIDLSHLRPAGSTVQNAARTSTGIVPFMERYSNSTREVAQGGRRGALMEMVDIRHPDAEGFIDAKMDGTSVTGANISVKLTDEFMLAVMNDDTFIQRFPVDATPDEAKVVKEVSAKKLWDKIVNNAHAYAEPGLFFWDHVKRESPADCYARFGFETLATNPCGEIPLCPYDSCRLLAMNLFGFVKNPFTDEAYFDFEEFEEAVYVAERLMDDIVDLELEAVDCIINKIKEDPEPDHVKRVEIELWQKIREKAEKGRRTGLGVTAVGDMLAALGIRYGSDDSIIFVEKVIQCQKLTAYRSSVDMAKERGAFPMYDGRLEENNDFIQRIRKEAPELYADMIEHGRRNISLLTIAPTGTTSMMAQTTSGIENLFLPFYFRSKKVNPNDENVRIDYYDDVGDAWQEYVVFHPRFRQWMQVKGYDVSNVRTWSKEKIAELAEESPYHGATVNDVDWVNKVKMQGAAQRHIDHAISVTVNLPQDIEVDKVKDVYETAWKSGCKGMTVYREGSRTGVLSSESKVDDTVSIEDLKLQDNHAPRRPDELKCDVFHFQNNKEKWIAFIGLMDDRPYEIFTGKLEEFKIPPSVNGGKIIKVKENGSSRYDFHYVYRNEPRVAEGLSRVFDEEYWNYAKLVSGLLRHGMPIPYVVEILKDLHLDDFINTWKAGVTRQLKRYIPDGTEATGDALCPNCGDEGHLVYQEGCVTCLTCGIGKCA